MDKPEKQKTNADNDNRDDQAPRRAKEQRTKGTNYVIEPATQRRNMCAAKI